MPPVPDLNIEHRPDLSRFEVIVQGHLCFANYRSAAGVMDLTHTEVAPELQGRGIAAALVRSALAHAKASGLKVNPLCSYAQAYMRRHPESMALRV